MSTDQRSPFALPNLNATPLTETSLFCGVSVDSNGNAVLPSAGAAIVGILYGLSTSTNAASIRGFGDGKVKVLYGGTVTLPATLKVNASGQFVVASASDIAAGSGVAQALEAGSANEIHPVVLLGGDGAQTAVSGDETVTSGALSAYTTVSYISVTGTQAYTLPNGLFNGQTKRIEVSVAASTPVGTLTITTPFTGEQATYGLNTVGQALEFVWRAATGWHITRKQRAGKNTYTVGTNNVGPGDLYEQVDLSVTGTVSSSFAAGNVVGETIKITVSTAASTPSGTLASTAIKSMVGVATSTGITAINATTVNGFLMWDGAFWQSISNTGFTYT